MGELVEFFVNGKRIVPKGFHDKEEEVVWSPIYTCVFILDVIC